jgi:hypothetical protein
MEKSITKDRHLHTLRIKKGGGVELNRLESFSSTLSGSI